MEISPVLIHVSIAGRMMFKRVMGKASFCNIQDLKGNIQVYGGTSPEESAKTLTEVSSPRHGWKSHPSLYGMHIPSHPDV